MIVTRFAPSPTGYLHLGHAYAALFAYEAGERFVLRIEDIDGARCRMEYLDAIYKDLAWLGIKWNPTEVLIQSEHIEDYQKTLKKLDDMGLIYRCYCTRRQIKEEAARIGGAPHEGETVIYSGKCRNLGLKDDTRDYSLRLNVGKAIALIGHDLYFEDVRFGKIKANPLRFGDVILGRKDCPASYYLASVIDDARQGITLVTRGEDLLAATDIQVLLQALLGLETPLYHHHKLILDDNGKRLAKRADAFALRKFREEGLTPDDIRKMLVI